MARAPPVRGRRRSASPRSRPDHFFFSPDGFAREYALASGGPTARQVMHRAKPGRLVSQGAPMMWLKFWRRNRKPNRCPRRAQGLGFRPRVESLETRTILSIYTAASASDLIADITAANKSGGSSTITL